MGIFDSDSDEEVKISPDNEAEETESRLQDEVKTEIVGSSTGSKEDSRSKSSRGRDIRERSKSKGKSSFRDEREVSLEDVYKQNKRIIELLESISEDSNEEDNDDEISGDLNGVL